MTDFDKAFEKLILNEGGYVDDKDDAGGKTYLGISYRSYPNSPIWDIIDPIVKTYKKPSIINRELKKNKNLINAIKNIYKQDYWNKCILNEKYSYKLKAQIFDSAVNIGVKKTLEIFKSLL